MAVSGIITLIKSIVGGAAISVGSGGTLAIGGVAIIVQGAIVGAATTALGSIICVSAIKNFRNDLSNC
jgi:hypothetical protein